MPSPTSRTRPTSRVSMPVRYCSISVWRTETISSALNLITASFNELVADLLELRANRGVVNPIAHADHEAANQVRLDSTFEDRLLTQAGAQLLDQLLALIGGQGDRALHFHANAAGALIP